MTLGALAFAVVSVAGQTNDPIVGTRKLDVAKSTYKPGPAPKSTTIVVTPEGKGIKVAVDAVSADGSPLKWGFTTLCDGKEEAPVTGSPMFNTLIGSIQPGAADSPTQIGGVEPSALEVERDADRFLEVAHEDLLRIERGILPFRAPPDRACAVAFG